MTTKNNIKNVGFTRDAANELLVDTGLADAGWTFKFDNARRRGGAAHFKDQTISMSRILVPMWTEEQILDTLIHEVSHALVGYSHKHDGVWRAKCIELGGSGRVTHDNPVVDRTEKLTCSNCGFSGVYFTRGKTRCPRCNSNRIRWSAAGAPAEVENVPVAEPANTTPATVQPAAGTCRCGCGQAANRVYLPGHDARHVSKVAGWVRSNQATIEEAMDELPTPALRAKLMKALHQA